VKAAQNTHQNKQIVVNVHGTTLYRLTGDTPCGRTRLRQRGQRKCPD